jgi:hypothetical protein
MNRKPDCGNKTDGAFPGIGKELAAEIKRLFPGKGPKEIASGLGVEVVYEKPVRSRELVRLSEYRAKQKQIAVFFREVEHTAIAHELFHHLESARGLKLGRDVSEREAKAFAEVLE